MPEKELSNNGEWLVQILPVMLAVTLSCVGGVVGYLHRIDKSGAGFSFFRFMLEIFTSGFVGIITFALCSSAEFQWSTTAALVAISGHMGTRALFIVENAASNVADSFLRRYTNGETKDAQIPNNGEEASNAQSTKEA